MTNENAVKLAVLIDADNAQPGIVEALLAEIAKYGTAHVKRAYGDWTGPSLKGWKDQLLAQSIQPMQQFAYTHRKNSTDSAMIIDAMDLLYSERFDGFCIISSDSDFTRLASRIRESGLIVYGFGERKTPKAFVSACDKFVYTENLQEPLAAPEEPEPARVSPALVKQLRSVVEAASDEDGWAMLSHVGQILTKQAPDFDPRTYGFGKLSDLITAITVLDVDRREAGSGKHAVIYVRDRRRRTGKS
ncbi:NYN domain-containing protein [Actinoplanes sp. NPDC049265]|uniref:NYN domain-containing protein n=1 Tax=Actinoplanes sp. NPDC049265 TaxID=3363902 RepID=UPI0037178E1B